MGICVLSPCAHGFLGIMRCPSFTPGSAGLGVRNPDPFYCADRGNYTDTHAIILASYGNLCVYF